jgi:hypothetical protein
MADDETNLLLREIRDLLAAQESKYSQHLADCQRIYKEQLDAAAAWQRKRAVLGAILMVGVVIALVAMSK